MSEKVLKKIEVNPIMTQIGECPIPNYRKSGTGGTEGFSSISGDNLVVICAGNISGFFAYVIKPTGDWCLYKSQSRKIDSYNIERFIVYQLSNNAYIISVGYKLYNFIIPNYFISGGVVEVPDNVLNIPPACGQTFDEAFFDFNSGLAAFESYQSFPLASNIFASIYKMNNLGLQKQQEGFIGNFPNGSDGFNRLSLSFPIGIGTNGIGNNSYGYDKGNYFYAPYWYNYPRFGKIGMKIVSDDVLSCSNVNSGNNGVNNTYVEGTGATNLTGIKNNFIFNPPSIYSINVYYQSMTQGGAIDVPGALMFGCENNFTIAISDTTMMGITDHSGLIASYDACGINAKGDFLVFQTPPFPYDAPYKIFKGYIPEISLLGTPSNTNKTAHQLMNLHRPVSILGKYRS